MAHLPWGWRVGSGYGHAAWRSVLAGLPLRVSWPDGLTPVFVSGQGRRLSPRVAQWRFAWWQRRAGFDRRYSFHSLRHGAITNVYRATRDLFLAQRFARHASPLTTIIYTHPADEELYEGVRNLPC